MSDSNPTPANLGTFSSWLERAAKLLYDAVCSTAGTGVSSTKVVWLSNGMLACYCACVATLGGVSVYLFFQKADAVYWSAVTALWATSIGFATHAKNHQVSITKEFHRANLQTQNSGTPNEGGAP